MDLVNAKASGAPGGGRILGEHPDGGPIVARAGRLGPYVSWEKVDATLPKSMTLDDIGLEQAIRLIQDRIASGGGVPKKPATKKPAAKKTAAKGAKAKKVIVDSDEPPFEVGGAAKKQAKKKPAGKGGFDRLTPAERSFRVCAARRRRAA